MISRSMRLATGIRIRRVSFRDHLADTCVVAFLGCWAHPLGEVFNCVGLSALTVAEFFLLFIDNIFRFVQAGSEVSALLGRLTSAVAYERITPTRNGSITSIQAVYVPAAFHMLGVAGGMDYLASATCSSGGVCSSCPWTLRYTSRAQPVMIDVSIRVPSLPLVSVTLDGNADGVLRTSLLPRLVGP